MLTDFYQPAAKNFFYLKHFLFSFQGNTIFDFLGVYSQLGAKSYAHLKGRVTTQIVT